MVSDGGRCYNIFSSVTFREIKCANKITIVAKPAECPLALSRSDPSPSLTWWRPNHTTLNDTTLNAEWTTRLQDTILCFNYQQSCSFAETAKFGDQATYLKYQADMGLWESPQILISDHVLFASLRGKATKTLSGQDMQAHAPKMWFSDI